MKKKNTMTLRAASAMMVAVMSLTAFSGIAANAGEYAPAADQTSTTDCGIFEDDSKEIAENAENVDEGALVISASAQEVTPISFAQTMKKTFDTSHDAAAPNVNKTAFEKAVKNLNKVGMYNIKEGKYYVVRTSRKVTAPSYNGKNSGSRTVYEYKLVKVERAFEDDRWWGTERTIDVRFCASGKTKRICPDAWFGQNHDVLFYEIGSFVC